LFAGKHDWGNPVAITRGLDFSRSKLPKQKGTYIALKLWSAVDWIKGICEELTPFRNSSFIPILPVVPTFEDVDSLNDL